MTTYLEQKNVNAKENIHFQIDINKKYYLCKNRALVLRNNIHKNQKMSLKK